MNKMLRASFLRYMYLQEDYSCESTKYTGPRDTGKRKSVSSLFSFTYKSDLNTILVCIKKSVLGLWIFLELSRQGTVRFVSRMQIKCINRLFWAIVAVVEKRKCFIPFLMLATRLVLWMCTRIICWAPFKIVGSKDLRQNFCLSIKFLPFADQYTAFCHSKKIGMREVMEHTFVFSAPA